jgi:hypothetical protein
MIFSIYLHKPIAETLMCYGDLSDVVNRILEVSETGVFDVVDVPKCEPRDGATKYFINVTNETYLSLVASFPPNSPRLSLRRLLYWFVEQEMYEVLEWETVNEYVSKDKEKILKKIGGIDSELTKLQRNLNYEEYEIVQDILEKLIKLKEVVENGR